MWNEKDKTFNTGPIEVLEERVIGWRTILQCGSEEARGITHRAIKVAIERARAELNR